MHLRNLAKPTLTGMYCNQLVEDKAFLCGDLSFHYSTGLSVSFYLAQQFSSRFKSLLAFLKYKMIISLRSMHILNANC